MLELRNLLSISLLAASGTTLVVGFIPNHGPDVVSIAGRLRDYRARSSRCSTSSTLAATCFDQENSHNWAQCALLISSFSDGIMQSKDGQAFLMNGLLSSMLSQERALLESKVEKSVLASPCNGPDPVTLGAMEQADEAQAGLQFGSSNAESVLGHIEDPVLRFLYIPTATYALRRDSDNTPGKQRQRARADGKKRRTQVINQLRQLLGESIEIHAVTMDLDDGSIKQPEGSDLSSLFPKDGKEALNSWKPHFVYVEGGNTFWLYHCMEKGGWKQDLLDAITGEEAAVYCGKSAGAIIAGARVDTATWKKWDDPSVVPGRGEYDDWEEIAGLDLVGGASIFPHMDEQWEFMVSEKKALLESRVYCLDDSEICLVDGQKREVTIIQSSQNVLHSAGI